MDIICTDGKLSIPNLTEGKVYTLARISPAGYYWLTNQSGEIPKELGPYLPTRFELKAEH